MVAGSIGLCFEVSQKAIVPVLIEKHRQAVLEFDRLNCPRRFRVRFWRGEHVVSRSACYKRDAWHNGLSSGQNVFEALGCLFGGIVAEDFQKVPFTRVESRNAVLLGTSDVALEDGPHARQTDAGLVGHDHKIRPWCEGAARMFAFLKPRPP